MAKLISLFSQLPSTYHIVLLGAEVSHTRQFEKWLLPGLAVSPRSLKTPLLQLEKLAGETRRLLAPRLLTSPGPKENNGRAARC